MPQARKAILRPPIDHRRTPPVNDQAIACACCGYRCAADACGHCEGTARSLDGRRVLPPPRRDRFGDAVTGVFEVRRALFALLHGREFIGQLRLPVTMNAIAITVVVLGGWFVLTPLFAAVFATPWWFADGLRQQLAPSAPGWWLAASWLWLGHPLCDLIAGAVQEPLRARTEMRMLGTPTSGGAAPGLLRVRDRARVLSWLLLSWPGVLLVSLLPWCGLPLLALLGAGSAAVTWFEAPLAARGLSLGQRLRLLWAHRWRALGTGLGLQFASAVPFVNLLALASIATLAATASHLQFEKRSPPAT